MGQGGFGRLEGHGHAVAGEGGDDGVGIAEREEAGCVGLQAEAETRYGGERSLAPLGRCNTAGEGGVAVFQKVGGE